MPPAPAETQKTPLYSHHFAAGARMVAFSGWQMPVHYSSILEEHHATRTAIGLFDISHMGELLISGPRAGEWLDGMLTNNVSRLPPGVGHYTLMLNENGGVLDDLFLYRLDGTRENFSKGPEPDTTFLLVVNAGKTEEDAAWLAGHLPESGVTLENRSSALAGLAVQGPRALELWGRLLLSPENGSRFSLKPLNASVSNNTLPPRNGIAGYTFYTPDFPGSPAFVWVARTGYTGEDGFELFLPATSTPFFWNLLLEKGADLGIKPCGLGARDTLRLEMGYPLSGADISPRHTPLEAGLSAFVDLEKPNFIGRAALLAQKENGIPQNLVAFKMQGPTPPPRAHYPVHSATPLGHLGNLSAPVGEITSGALSPSLGVGIGMAYLPPELARPHTEISIEIRGKHYPATVEKKPLYRKKPSL